jgi:murein DD-endopeptidase MepM/ murein hydrolase activator NlpD
MPRRSSAHHVHNHCSTHDGPGGPADAPIRRWSAGYTLAHAGRQLRLGPIAFWVVVGTLVVMAVWSITTATYFAFREDVLTRLIARQAEMQFGYEDRIAELRGRIDRISGRQLIDQEQYEQKLEQILRRQSALEARAGAVGEATGSIKQPGRTLPLKPSLLNDKGAFLMPLDRGAPGDPRTSILAKGAGGISGALVRLQASLDRVEQRQSATLTSMAETYDSKARRIRGVLADLGVDLGRGASVEGGVGGPFVPVVLNKEALGFERQLHRIKSARAMVARLTNAISSIPLRKPVDGDIDPASGFGVRMDPFTSSPAMHTGLDLHGETGDPVRATADGKVTSAGWSGGYGRVIDIDHGNGMSTRYGHLSAIDVRVGQSIRTGQIIGRIGSTGRSTGPHLHYETRVRGGAVDPQKFLRAGQKLDANL